MEGLGFGVLGSLLSFSASAALLQQLVHASRTHTHTQLFFEPPLNHCDASLYIL